MFLDPSDFQDVPYYIPNPEESRTLQDFIDKKEAEYLKKVLGLSLYNDFVEGLETSGTIETKWINLRDGGEYTYNGTPYEYLGVKDLLRPVIYSDWLAINFRKYGNSGMIINTGQQNSGAVNPDQEIIRAWNEFVDKCGNGYYCYGSWSNVDTLYGFMYQNASDYNDWTGSKIYPFEKRNVFDL